MTGRATPRRLPRRLGVLVLSAALGLAGCDAATIPPSVAAPASVNGPPGEPTPTAEPRVDPATWTDCGGGKHCATVRLPLDHGAGTGIVNVSLVRLPAVDKMDKLGTLFVNPGGPGASGVDFVKASEGMFRQLREQFDIVGFDPRGVNLSSPIRCLDDLDGLAALDPSPDSDVELAALVDQAKDYADACQRRNPGVLPHLSTDDVVIDLDRLRQAVGDEKLNYLGFSYGTLIGALYADRYPDRVGVMALDGALDPASSLEELRSSQAIWFERALGVFLADCKKDGCTFARDDDPRRVFEQIVASIEEKPLPAAAIGSRRSAGPGLAWSAILGSMYSPQAWSGLDESLALARRGDGSGLLLLSDPFRGRNRDGSYSNLIDAYTANTCADYPASDDPADYTAVAAAAAERAPHFAEYAAYNDLACAFWAVDARRTPAPVSADGAPPILVVGTTGDPATPFEWAESLAAQLDSGVLLRYEGEGHTAFGQNGCVTDRITNFLLTAAPPPEGTTC